MRVTMRNYKFEIGRVWRSRHLAAARRRRDAAPAARPARSLPGLQSAPFSAYAAAAALTSVSASTSSSASSSARPTKAATLTVAASVPLSAAQPAPVAPSRPTSPVPAALAALSAVPVWSWLSLCDAREERDAALSTCVHAGVGTSPLSPLRLSHRDISERNVLQEPKHCAGDGDGRERVRRRLAAAPRLDLALRGCLRLHLLLSPADCSSNL